MDKALGRRHIYTLSDKGCYYMVDKGKLEGTSQASQLHVNPPNLGSQMLRFQRGAAPFTCVIAVTNLAGLHTSSSRLLEEEFQITLELKIPVTWNIFGRFAEILSLFPVNLFHLLLQNHIYFSFACYFGEWRDKAKELFNLASVEQVLSLLMMLLPFF